MRVEWLNEARNEFLAFLKFYKTEVGIPYAKKFAEKILHATEQLADFPELGVLKYDTLMGKHGFRALFIDQYVCIYKIEMDTVYIYHFADAAMVIFRSAICGYESGCESDVYISSQPLPTFTAQRLGERCGRGVRDLSTQGAGEGASHL